MSVRGVDKGSMGTMLCDDRHLGMLVIKYEDGSRRTAYEVNEDAFREICESEGFHAKELLDLFRKKQKGTHTIVIDKKEYLEFVRNGLQRRKEKAEDKRVEFLADAVANWLRYCEDELGLKRDPDGTWTEV